MNAFAVRTAALGILVLGFVACSSIAVPTSQNAPGTTAASKVRPDASCGSMTFVPGANGPFTVGIGDTCTMNVPPDTGCVPDVTSGYEYQFLIQSGGSDGTLTGGGIGSSSAKFKRTSSGEVVINLRAYSEDSGDNCRPAGGFIYGYVTLD